MPVRCAQREKPLCVCLATGDSLLRYVREALERRRGCVMTPWRGGCGLNDEIHVVAYEGEHGRSVLDYAVARAKRDGAKLLIVHILEWSPYQFLTREELAERHKRRREELSRAEAAVIAPALAAARAAGVEAESALRYGNVVDLVVEIAKDAGASLIFVGRSGASGFGARIFGSVPIGVAQISPIPTVIVP